MIAIGAIQALYDSSLDVPRDVSVVGFDDIPGAMYHRPGLTTVRQPLRLMGETAARTLLTQLEHSDNGAMAPARQAGAGIPPDRPRPGRARHDCAGAALLTTPQPPSGFRQDPVAMAFAEAYAASRSLVNRPRSWAWSSAASSEGGPPWK